MIYFDNGATTYPKPEPVYRQMEWAMRQAVNIGRGSYALARQGADMAEEVRRRLLTLCHGQGDYQVILSPSATVAANQVLQGLDWQKIKRVYLTPYEHNAIARTVAAMSSRYHTQLCMVPVRADGAIDLEQLAYQFTQAPPDLLCSTMVSNVTGYVLPVKEMTGLAQSFGATVVLDGAQGVGLIPVDLELLCAEYVIFAGHKTLYGPFGIGGFFMKKQAVLSPVLCGGNGIDSLNVSMNQAGVYAYEPGSPDYTALAGLLAALKWLEDTGTDKILAHEQRLNAFLQKELWQITGVVQYLAPDMGTGITAFNVSGYTAEDVGRILDEEFEIAVRTGYHCAPYVHEVIGDMEYLGCVRIGMSVFTTRADVEKLIQAIWSIASE